MAWIGLGFYKPKNTPNYAYSVFLADVTEPFSIEKKEKSVWTEVKRR